MIRSNGGANGGSSILHRGTGTLQIAAQEDGDIKLDINGTTRVTVNNSGATVTGTLNATTNVQVNGTSVATAGKAIAMAFIFG